MSTPLINVITLLMPGETSSTDAGPSVGILPFFITLIKSPGPATFVVLVMVVMSVWALWIVIDRWSAFSKARTQSRQYIPLVTKYLRENKLQEAIDQAKRYKDSHIAKVVSAALLEFKTDTEEGLHYDVVESAKRSVERVTLLTQSQLKEGLGVLATIGSSGPFVGLFGTVLGIIHAFEGMSKSGSGGIGSVAGGIAEALYTTAGGLLVAIPAVMMFNKFSNDVEKFTVEMNNTASELVDYFIKHNPQHHPAK